MCLIPSGSLSLKPLQCSTKTHCKSSRCSNETFLITPFWRCCGVKNSFFHTIILLITFFSAIPEDARAVPAPSVMESWPLPKCLPPLGTFSFSLIFHMSICFFSVFTSTLFDRNKLASHRCVRRRFYLGFTLKMLNCRDSWWVFIFVLRFCALSHICKSPIVWHCSIQTGHFLPMWSPDVFKD